MALTENASGVFIISATPFTDDGQIDYASADTLVDYYIGHGVTGMTILGLMGEAQKLTAEESDAFMRHMIDRVAGRIPVIVGVSNLDMTALAGLAHAAMAAGAAGVMVAPARGTQDVYAYFADVFAALGPDVPVCLQDFPLTTGVQMSVDTFTRLVADFAQLVMLKHEDWPGLNKITAIRGAGGRRVSILCGNGGMFLPEEVERGADGAMTGFAYPEMLVGVVELTKAGKNEAAHDLFDAYLPIVRLEQQQSGAGLALRKEILRRRGAIASAALRQPGPSLGPEDHGELDRLMGRLERRLAGLGVTE
ncbi:MAG: dihydrodipicolinate synthase family protein [Pseudomonadota bacterium]